MQPIPKRFFLNESQHVLITGATGFIGQVLCKALIRDGNAPTLLVRDREKAARLFGQKARYITQISELDVSTPLDVVINLAGEPVLGRRWTAGRKAAIESSRVGTTTSLVEWIGKSACKPRLFISASAIGYYGVQQVDDPTPLTETNTGQPIFMSEFCQRWENSARAVERFGVALSILRIGVVLGNGGGALPKLLLPLRLGIGGRIGDGRQVISWIHIDDVIGIIALLMALPAASVNGTFNVTAPNPATQKEFMRIAAQVMRRRWIAPIPAFLFRLLLGEQAVLLVDGQRAVPARVTELGYRFSFGRLADALSDLCGPSDSGNRRSRGRPV